MSFLDADGSKVILRQSEAEAVGEFVDKWILGAETDEKQVSLGATSVFLAVWLDRQGSSLGDPGCEGHLLRGLTSFRERAR